MIVFGIHCNFFTVLPIRLKTCRSNVFLQDKMRAPKKSSACRTRDFSRPAENFVWKYAFSILVLSTNKKYSSFLKKVFINMLES